MSIKNIDISKIGICITFNPLFKHIFLVENPVDDFRKISQIGYKGIELSLRDVKDIDWEFLNGILKENSLELICLSTGLIRKIDGLSLIHEDKNKRQFAIDRMSAMIELFGRQVSRSKNLLLGYTKGTLSDKKEDHSHQIEILKESLSRLIPKAEREDVIIGIEVINHLETNFINNISEGLELISEFRSKNIKLILDTYHMHIEEESIRSSIIKAAGSIGYVHLCDDNRGFPGSGNINFNDVFTGLEEAGYNGYFTMEFKPSEDRFLSIKKGFDYIKGKINSI